MSDREFTDITADVDALLADPSHPLAIASARESLARADREWANVSPKHQRRASSRIATSNVTVGTGWDSLVWDFSRTSPTWTR